MQQIKNIIKGLLHWLYLAKLPFRYYRPSNHVPKYLDLNTEDAEKILSGIHPDMGQTCLCQNNITPTHDLHIIIPVYNTAQFVGECLDSILEQKTRYTFFISITNDGSTDNSKNVLETYLSSIPDKKQLGAIEVRHQANMGPATARNIALENIRGSYIMFVDSDDKLLPGAIESLMTAAIDNDADMAEGYSNCGLTHGFAWGKVYKAELFRNIHFPPGYWFEDTITAFFLYHICSKRILVKGKHYYYRLNQNSITNSFQGNERTVDSLWVSRRVLSDYFSAGHQATSLLLREYLQDTISTARHFRTLNREDVMQALFAIHCSMAEKFFSNMLAQKECIGSLSFDQKYMALALKEKDYRRFRCII